MDDGVELLLLLGGGVEAVFVVGELFDVLMLFFGRSCGIICVGGMY